MDLTKAMLPEAVEVSGAFYKIKTGHSYWFRFSQMIAERTLLVEFDCFYDGEPPQDRQAGVEALSRFYYEPKEIPRTEDSDGSRVLDYTIDAELIYSALLQCYGIDLFDEQLHWHKVRAMIAGITGTRLNDIIGYRGTDPGKCKELSRLKRVWSLPEEVTEEDKERLQAFADQFHAAQF